MKNIEKISEVKSIYEGKVNNIITVEKLCQKINLTAGNFLLKGDITFLKFIYDNKTLLIADRNIKNNISWDQLNEYNLVFGKIIEIDNIKYKIRLLTASEWNKLIVKYTPLDQDSHWENIQSWCQNIYSVDSLKINSFNFNYRILCESLNINFTFTCIIPSYFDNCCGWRSCLEML